MLHPVRSLRRVLALQRTTVLAERERLVVQAVRALMTRAIAIGVGLEQPMRTVAQPVGKEMVSATAAASLLTLKIAGRSQPGHAVVPF